MIIPRLKITIRPESNPPKSRILARRLAVLVRAWLASASVTFGARRGSTPRARYALIMTLSTDWINSRIHTLGIGATKSGLIRSLGQTASSTATTKQSHPKRG